MRNCLLILTLFYLSFQVISSSENDSCILLALQGGGDHGAYQAGAIKGLVYNLPSDKVKYDIITGISAGTLNGAGFSLFDVGQEKEAADFLISIWRSIEDKEAIYRNWRPFWVFGPLYALFFKSGFYDTTPLKNLLNSILENKTIKRDLHVGITNIQTGLYEIHEVKTLSKEDLIKVVMSSSAVPVIFPSIKYNNTYYEDGGVIHGIDVVSGINECRNKGFSDDKIIVDIIKCFGKSFKEQDPNKLNTMKAFIRSLEIWKKDRGSREIEDIIDAYPKINWRYIVEPSTDLPNPSLPLKFKKADLELMMTVGEQDAINVVKKYEESPENSKINIINEVRNNIKTRMITKRAIPNIENSENISENHINFLE